MAGKWLEMLKEIAPSVNRVAFLFNPTTATYAEYYLKPFKAAAVFFAVEAIAAPVRDRSELESGLPQALLAVRSLRLVLPPTISSTEPSPHDRRLHQRIQLHQRIPRLSCFGFKMN